MPPVRTFWLSLHLPYACRHSGACCSSGWPIPIEHARVAAAASLRRNRQWLLRVESVPADVAGVIATTRAGHCVFHRAGCEIHRAFGHQAIPSACQHFPRQVLLDPRGVFVTLSHYCPTAADLLFTHQGPVRIVEGPPAVPDGEPEGLDARDVLPPLLRGNQSRRKAVLMDLDGYSAWEAHLVRALTEGDGSPQAILDRLDGDLARLQEWHPGTRSLREEVGALTERRSRRANTDASGDPAETVIRRYLAARAFGSWEAYGPDGAAGVLRHLRRALVTLRQHASRLPLKEAVRQTDLELVHRQAVASDAAPQMSNSATTGP